MSVSFSVMPERGQPTGFTMSMRSLNRFKPNGIGKHMVILQNRDAVLDRPLDLSVGVLGQHLFHIFNGSGSAFFVDFFAQ